MPQPEQLKAWYRSYDERCNAHRFGERGHVVDTGTHVGVLRGVAPAEEPCA